MQVIRATDNATVDIPTLSIGGVANVAVQDSFCAAAACYIHRIYDQSPLENHLDVAPAGSTVRTPDKPVNATRWPITVSGQKVYSAYFEGGMGYRNDNTTGVAKDNDPETLYMVVAGDHYNAGCCFDYGNAEIKNRDDGPGTMEAIYFGNNSKGAHGTGSGPWIMADLESGLWPGNETGIPTNTPQTSAYVTAFLKGGSNGFALKGGDATQGPLTSLWDGPRPYEKKYQPMKKQGAIILGIGGDNSNHAYGTWFEGAITTGYSTDEADDAVQADIVQAQYGA